MQMRVVCRCVLYADACCMQMRVVCRCVLYADACCMQMRVVCRCLLYGSHEKRCLKFHYIGDFFGFAFLVLLNERTVIIEAVQHSLV